MTTDYCLVAQYVEADNSLLVPDVDSNCSRAIALPKCKDCSCHLTALVEQWPSKRVESLLIEKYIRDKVVPKWPLAAPVMLQSQNFTDSHSQT